MDSEMIRALEADAEKLRQLTGEDHTPVFLVECPKCKGTGLQDTGGTYPWGEGIFDRCDCDDFKERAMRYEPRIVPEGMPTNCCLYGVVDRERGMEVCRVWDEEDARRIARLLNEDASRRSAVLDELFAAGV